MKKKVLIISVIVLIVGGCGLGLYVHNERAKVDAELKSIEDETQRRIDFVDRTKRLFQNTPLTEKQIDSMWNRNEEMRNKVK